jgi:chloramphenicol O-acetyltransferase
MEEKRFYPDPKNLNKWEDISIKYTYARGATELFKNLLMVINSQQDIVDKYKKKSEQAKGGNVDLWTKIKDFRL